MLNQDPQAAIQMLDGFVHPWQESITDPARAQQNVLKSLIASYASTEYGHTHAADQIKTLEDYRRSFPVMTYEEY